MNHLPQNKIRILTTCIAISAVLILLFQTGTAAAGSASPSPAEVLEEIEKKLGELETVHSEFKQTKQLAVFDREMIIRGEMAIEEPGKMAWRVDEPVKYTMVVEGTRLTQWDEDTDSVETLELDEDPAFQAVFDQLTIWFSGRYSAFADKYEITVKDTEPYTLKFTPEEDTMFQQMLERVKVVFRDDIRYIRKVDIKEKSGDRTIIEFHNTRLNIELDEEIWEVRPR